jgi:hypothetical protein
MTIVALEIHYGRGDTTALITPDALCVSLRQSGFPASARTAEDGVVEVESDGVVLEVYVDAGFVSEIIGDITFVDDRRTNRLLELLETMGWQELTD